MEPSIPIPTDNAYKFAAFFGLAVLISSMVAIVYTYDKYFERGYTDFIELEVLKAKDILSADESVRKTALELKQKTDQANKRSLLNFLMACMGGSIALSLMGGVCWLGKVQPKQDELLNLQIEKMKCEIQVLDKQLERKKTEA
jgi:hypothetical protein